MELKTYIEIFLRRIWLVILAIVLCTVGAVAMNYVATPTYVSSTTLRITTIGADTANGRRDITYTERLMNTYAKIATGRQMYRELTERLNLQSQPQIVVDTVPNTELMTIRITADSPEAAFDVASATAEIIIERSLDQFADEGQSRLDILSRQLTQIEEELRQARHQYDQLVITVPRDESNLDAARQSIDLKERTYTNLLAQYEDARINDALRENSIYVVEPANIPTKATSPRVEVNIVLGLMVGMLAGFVLALLRENLDNRLYTKQQFEHLTSFPVIGEIPNMKEPLLLNKTLSNLGPQIEAFRRLRISLLRANKDRERQTILVTSAEAGEGKSNVAVNLALTMAQTGRQIVLVDCNLNDPSLHQLFDLPNSGGLMDVLLGQITVAGALKDTSFPTFRVMTSGLKSADLKNPLMTSEIIPQGLANQLRQGPELLGSPSMAKMLKELQQNFDIIILDTPALLTVSDALVLVPMANAIVLVAARGKTKRNAFRSAYQQLLNVGAETIQVVMNRV